MKWVEANPIPEACGTCKEQVCYNCDYAEKRWSLSKTEDLLLRRRMLEKAILRAQKQIEEIDKELRKIK